jgi:hypothetical protein
MGLTFTANYWGDKFQVEVTRDGDLVFLDYDVEYDEACLEFSYPATSATKLLGRWRDNPSQTIVEKFELVHEQRERFTRDCWTHIVESTKDPAWTGLLPEAAREILAEAPNLTTVVGRAAWIAGDGASENDDSQEFMAAYSAEVAWQLRRFIDVMEALERGEDWPPLEATP